MKPILLGQSPSRTSGPGAFPAGSSSCRRLAQLLGAANDCDVGQLLDLRNLLPRWPGYTKGNGHGKADGRRRHGGDHFPWKMARRAAERLWDEVALPFGGPYPEIPRIIFAGHKAAECFGTFSQRDFETLKLRLLSWRGRSALVGILPHPSGVNHWYTDACNIRAAAVFLRKEAGIQHLARTIALAIPTTARHSRALQPRADRAPR